MASDFDSFTKTIWDFYSSNKRDLLWRKTENPYHIVVSEIMLQQTQVSRVTEKYKEFLSAFPTWESLANASFAEVLSHWSGLGYNRRAKFLHMMAQKVVNECKGTLPQDPLVLETFPGIGKATAASITVYAFNKPIPFIETNVRRIYIHHFFKDKENISDSEILPLVEQTIDKKNPREWYWALMDYGTYLAQTIENPNRKSKHYAKQSKFEGSVRKVRGEILRQLLMHKKLTEEDIYALDEDKEKVKKAVEGLMKDKMVIKKNSYFYAS